MKNRFRYLLVVGVILQLLSMCFNKGDTSKSLAIAPLAIGAFAASAGAALNGMINNQNKKNAEYSMQLQKDLMDYSWRKYNSPQAQAKAYADAGFNPAVAFGQGGMSSPVAPSVQAPELNQIGMSSSDLATLVNTGSSALLSAAEAKKVGLEAEGQKLLNDYNSQTLDERIRAVALQNKWTAEDTARITQSVGLMSGEFNMLQQKVENLKSEKQLTDKHVEWFNKQMTAEINDLQASAKYKNAVADLTDQQKELLSRSMQDLVDINHLNAENLNQVVGLLKKYGDAQAVVGMLTQLIGSASDLMGAFMKIPKIKDFLSNKD